MYYVQKVLNNNALLVSDDKNAECILLGKGIGWGKKIGEYVEGNTDIKEYKLVAGDNRLSQIGQGNGIEPQYLEAAGQIIEVAQQVFGEISSDILLPLADHIAFAAKRAREKMVTANPFIPDIKVLYGREYAVALECRESVRELAGYEISDDEAGFIALHIHSGLSHEEISETLRDTQIINRSMQWIDRETNKEPDKSAMTYIRLLSHLYYMIVRARNGGKVNIALNEYMRENYTQAMILAEKVCAYISSELGQSLDEQESGYLAIHIQRYFAE